MKPNLIIVDDHTASQFDLPHGGVYEILPGGRYRYLEKDLTTYLSKQPNDLVEAVQPNE